MNSMYGNTILEPVEVDTVVKDSRDDCEKHISLHYNCIDYVLEVNGR